jgi:hypothetical protein
MKDLLNEIDVRVSVKPQVQTNDSTAIVGEIIDRDGFASVTHVIATGVLTDANATFAVTMEHGDAANLSDTAAVTATDLIGDTKSTSAGTSATALANAAFTFGADTKCRKLGYCGAKRYSRITITPTGNDAGAAPVAAIAILGHAQATPTVNPPTA